MAIDKQDIIELFEHLPEKAKQSAFDYLQFLSAKHRPDWDDIFQLSPDIEPLSAEEEEQISRKEGFITGEEAKREFNLKVDLP